MPDGALSCSDVIAVYQRAVTIAGQPQAQNVIRRFGTQFAATLAPQHYAEAIKALSLLIHSQENKVIPKLEATPDPAAVKARWAAGVKRL